MKPKIVYIKGKGGGKSRKSQYVDYLISQGIDIETIEYTNEIRGRNISVMIIDELAKECVDENRTR